MHLNQTSVWKVMTILISRELPMFNFERLDILCEWIGHPNEKLWPFQFLERFHCSISSVLIYYVPESDIRVKSYDHLNLSRTSVVQFRASRYIMPQFEHPSEKLCPFDILESFLYSISSIWICYAPKSGIRVKIYDHLNFSRASVVQFRASRYIMRIYRISELKVMTIWISREFPLFNFERLDILCARISHAFE